ncbi:MAG: hypothetical protein HYY81_01815, partial [Deltaproteobacteria bacterium]|nr:hypothetical protein [Deltaproteobacteria bacterium]
INYYPIFYTARELLQCFSADQGVSQAVDNLLDVSLKIVAWRASLRHDLAGRIYHRILEEAKYLGAYYTSIPSAALLLYLALRQDESPYDWSDIGSLEGLRIADLACGTGTLLMAAADMVVDNYIRACVGKAIAPEIEKVHQMIVGKVIYGYDVLPSAVHLTASTLTLRVPDTPINVTHLYRMPLGGGERALGSLNFLETDSPAATLFGQPEQVTGKGFRGGSAAELPALDLCVMNPPFTRSVGGNLLFGNLPEADRKPMQKRLQQIVAEQGLSASITAGLGSVFVGLADRSLKANGRLALVLPRAVLSGVAWKRTRELIESCYTLEYIIVSHEPNHWNFSENTDLSAVLLIAQRRNEAAQGDRVICVNLWRQPANAIEALSLARMVFGTAPPDIASEAGSLQLSVGGKKFGEAVAVEWPALKGGLWSFPCSFAQSEIVRASCHLRAGRLYLPGQGVVGRLPLTPLGNLADLGPDRRDIHDGFELVQGRTSYPAFWNHDSTAVHHLEQTPNQYLSPLSRAKENRPLREATDLWPKAGRVLVAERLRLNTHRLVALRLTRKVLGNVWWPVVLKRGLQDIENAEKALVLWLNSTLGLLLILAYREETEGAWVQFKKPVLGEVPVLDVSTLDRKSLADLASTYDSLAEQSLGSFPEMEWDSTRSAIDEAIARTLGLQDFSILRELLGREPTICLRLERLLGG